jgi:hypothetical protein
MFKRIKLFKYYLILGLQKTYHASGITSICKDDNHIILWDFDKIKSVKKDLIPSLKKLQRQHNLSNIYLFRSSPGKYHAYCLKKHDFHDMFRIIRLTTFTDDNFLIYTARRMEGTLRISPKKGHKPIFIQCILSKTKGNGSSAHREFLKKLIPNSNKLFNKETLNWDNDYRLIFTEYDTGEQK